jgi:hypothetical protein
MNYQHNQHHPMLLWNEKMLQICIHHNPACIKSLGAPQSAFLPSLPSLAEEQKLDEPEQRDRLHETSLLHG